MPKFHSETSEIGSMTLILATLSGSGLDNLIDAQNHLSSLVRRDEDLHLALQGLCYLQLNHISDSA